MHKAASAEDRTSGRLPSAAKAEGFFQPFERVLDRTVPNYRTNMRFLELPAELRNTIYDLVLTNGDTLEIRHRHVFEINHGSVRALTQVSKQVRAECLPLYYTSNSFLLLSMDDCVAWLNIVGRDCRHLRALLLGDGVLEGASWASPRTYSLNRVRVSWRLSNMDGLSYEIQNLTAEEVVEDGAKAKAEARLKVIGDTTKDFGPLGLTVTGTMYHCSHCHGGVCVWCRYHPCCMKDSEDSD